MKRAETSRRRICFVSDEIEQQTPQVNLNSRSISESAVWEKAEADSQSAGYSE
jgi:hypothetical protein